MRTTTKLIVGGIATQGLGAVIVLAIGLAGCPHNPPPVPSELDASDAAPSPVPVPDPLKTCVDACTHAETVCPGAGAPCGPACVRLHDATWNACVAAVPAGPGACPSLNACDPLNGVAGVRQRPVGR